MAKPTIRDKIIQVLEAEGGEVIDPDGLAAQKIFDKLPEHNKSSVSTKIGEMIEEGVLWDQRPGGNPKARRRTRIAMTKHFPPKRSLRQITHDLKNRVNDVISDFEEEFKDLDEGWLDEIQRLEEQQDKHIRQIHELQEALGEALRDKHELKEKLEKIKNDLRSAKGVIRKLQGKEEEPEEEEETPQPTFKELLDRDGRDWSFTHHARKRMREMALTEKDVVLALIDPEVDYVSSDYGEHRRMAQRGDLAVAYDEKDEKIITVLWRKTEEWTRDEYREKKGKA